MSSGPKMPLALMGHCAAEASPTEIVIAGGFSPDDADYISTAYIYNIKTEEWTTKSWMKLERGPVMDMACSTVNWFGKRTVMLAGGWNNIAVKSTEIFDLDKLSWSAIEVVNSIDTDIMDDPLPITLRSSVMAELNRVPVLSGGVSCSRFVCQQTTVIGLVTKPFPTFSAVKPNCSRIDTVLELKPTPGNVNNPTEATWTEMDITLSQPKSGHTLLVVPKKFARNCVLLP